MQPMTTYKTQSRAKTILSSSGLFQKKTRLKIAFKQGRQCLRPCWMALLVVVLLLGYAHADEVIMKNGDRLQGKIVSMDSGELVLETTYAGKVTIAWDQVARLTSEDILEISLPDEEAFKGKAIAAEDGTLVLMPETGPATEPIAMSQVQTLAPPKPPEKWKFTARVAAGLDIEKGNTDKDNYNGDFRLGLSKRPHRITLYGEHTRENTRGEITSDNSLFNLDYNRFISEKWYLFGNGQTQRDKFQDLDLLWSVAGGAGYQVWESKKKNLSLQIGPSYVSENYSEPQPSFDNKDHRDYAAGFWAIDFDMWFFKRVLQIFHHDDGFVSFEDSDVWRLRTRTGIRIPIIHHLFTSLQYNYDWVNSPADGRLNYDSRVLFKLGWEY